MCDDGVDHGAAQEADALRNARSASVCTPARTKHMGNRASLALQVEITAIILVTEAPRWQSDVDHVLHE